MDTLKYKDHRTVDFLMNIIENFEGQGSLMIVNDCNDDLKRTEIIIDYDEPDKKYIAVVSLACSEGNGYFTNDKWSGMPKDTQPLNMNNIRELLVYIEVELNEIIKFVNNFKAK